MASQEEEYIYLIICLETRKGHLAPHILPLHRLGVRTRIPSKEYDVPIYVRSLDTPSRQAPLNLQVEPVWNLTSENRITVNKVAVVEAALKDAEPLDMQVGFDESAFMENMQTLVAVYITC